VRRVDTYSGCDGHANGQGEITFVGYGITVSVVGDDQDRPSSAPQLVIVERASVVSTFVGH